MKSSLIDYFITLVKIDSESKHEREVAKKLKKDLEKLGAEVRFDEAHTKTGGDVGNLYAYIPGKIDKQPILFCAHMDTVVPGTGIKPKIEGNKIISSGDTILGADDKSGIAQIICAIKEIKSSKEDHAPVEILFTISEEIGLLGAKHCNCEMLRSKIGYALDAHEVGNLTIGAPSQNSMEYTIYGKESHAGAEPEKGINAIRIASEAIANMPLGRIDDETTNNIGIIEGGKATNIIPAKVKIKAEARSHNEKKLLDITKAMSDALLDAAKKHTVDGTTGSVDIKVMQEYRSFHLDEADELVKLSEEACRKVGIEHKTSVGGGGSDANIFNYHGIKTAIAGTGMQNVHTLQESIRISDLVNGCKWVTEVIRCYSNK
jgi:tripeptide aminopeptidase